MRALAEPVTEAIPESAEMDGLETVKYAVAITPTEPEPELAPGAETTALVTSTPPPDRGADAIGPPTRRP